MAGWWWVRYGDALAWVETLTAEEAVRRSLELNAMSDWTDDSRELAVFAQDAYSENSGRHDYTHAVQEARHSPPRPRRAGPRSARSGATLASLATTLVLALGFVPNASAETWRGLTVAPEHRCAPYDKKRDYPYPQSVEQDIVRELGAVYGPYTGRCFASTTETDIEHIVAASEAHDSGLCAADPATKARFARDLRNLTLASPQVNRHEKGGKDAADWVPVRNACWFAGRVVEVKQVYDLTVNRREAAALEVILSSCASTALESIVCEAPLSPGPSAASAPAGGSDPLALYDDNRNGQITCAEARRHGIAPVRRSHPAYVYMRDGDGDGVVCE
ncbi:MAG: excalibur calcium-binding domain-containing protein [Gammaproteobacteria bacterium]|nr:excalibur calcium-binding domain-containing protein [Gammaproteobacteria bacterium]